MAVSYSGSDSDLRSRVRDSLGGADPEFITDGNIDEQKDTKVVPFLDKQIDETKHDQDDIDDAVVVYTAYRAFSAIPLMSTISGGGLTANLSPAQYRKELRHDASVALARLGVTLPDEGGSAPFTAHTEGMIDKQ